MRAAGARAGAYRWLARWFLAPPDAVMVEKLRSPAGRAALAHVPGGDALAAALPPGGAAVAADELSVAWTRLFSAPGPDQVPPYESIYRDRGAMELPADPEYGLPGGSIELEGQLCGESTLAVARAYAAAGVTLAPSAGVLGDHLGAELAFMALLCDRQAAALAAGDAASARMARQRQREFLAEHLARWLPEFAARVGAHAAHPFFVALCRLAAAFVAADAERLTSRRPCTATGAPPCAATAAARVGVQAPGRVPGPIADRRPRGRRHRAGARGRRARRASPWRAFGHHSHFPRPWNLS